MAGEERIPRLSEFLTPEHGVLRAQPLRDLVGKSIVVKAVEFHNLGGRDVAVLITREGERYYTFSRVVVRQARVLSEVLKKFPAVLVEIKKVKNYYVLG